MRRLPLTITLFALLSALALGVAFVDASPPPGPAPAVAAVIPNATPTVTPTATATLTPTATGTHTPHPTATFSPADRGLCILPCDDVNHNGLCDAGEHAIPGQTVEVYDIATRQQLLASHTFVGDELVPYCWPNLTGLRKGEFAVRAVPPAPFFTWGAVYASVEMSSDTSPLPPPTDLGASTYSVQVNTGRSLYFALDLLSTPPNTPTPTATPPPIVRRAPADFDGDNKTDIGVWRPDISASQWWILRSSAGFAYNQALLRAWGVSTDQPVVGDYDGDRTDDLGVWRPATGEWWILLSSKGFAYDQASARVWGAAGDQPVVGDYDGDGKADLGVWRPATGEWRVLLSSRGFDTGQPLTLTWGSSGDKPVIGDYDGDGKADPGVWRPATGEWRILLSSRSYDAGQPLTLGWGINGDQPVVGDYDGDGQSDPGVWRPATGEWWILLSSKGFAYARPLVRTWGVSGDVPVVGDYDGDGLTDIAVWQPNPSAGQWWVLLSSKSFDYSQALLRLWGVTGDIPLGR